MRKGLAILGIFLMLIGLMIAGLFGALIAEANSYISSGLATAGSGYGADVGMAILGVIILLLGTVILVLGFRGKSKKERQHLSQQN